ncbi:hypothetical protein [Methylobacterium sp. SyP6R]|uniref:hypothetical protein n=1 Tax=Methylobacterium sp. SyP6R TaxID=2718876 RepID=UPI001F25B7DB|nr:hypothetical protein [Methylobacterium sp. SyP6R]MCF4128442.1 hypothetical protein [Methylobacterium sp. SyP6R]
MNLAFLIDNARREPGHPRLEGDDLVVHALRNARFAGDDDKSDLANLVADVLNRTDSSKVRNAAALLLTDLIGRGADQSIIRLLERPGMLKMSGSLLFALNNIEAILPLDLIVTIIEEGSLEAQGEALVFLESGRITETTDDAVQASRQRLQDLSARTNDKNLKIAADIALECLDDIS